MKFVYLKSNSWQNTFEWSLDWTVFSAFVFKHISASNHEIPVLKADPLTCSLKLVWTPYVWLTMQTKATLRLTLRAYKFTKPKNPTIAKAMRLVNNHESKSTKESFVSICRKPNKRLLRLVSYKGYAYATLTDYGHYTPITLKHSTQWPSAGSWMWDGKTLYAMTSFTHDLASRRSGLYAHDHGV